MVTNDQIIDEVAKKLKLPREQVRIVMLDFFHEIRTALQQPHQAFEIGIKINNCFKITVNPGQILKRLKNSLENRPDTYTTTKLLTLNQKLLKNEIYTKRQSEVAQEYERLRLQREQECDQNSNQD